VETYAIPAGLAGSTRIAIRLESPQGFFAYNWFWNNTTGVVTPVPPTATITPGGPTLTPTAPPYVGIPTFNIQSVVANTSVTILTNNFPPNQTFTVRMGAYGTAGYRRNRRYVPPILALVEPLQKRTPIPARAGWQYAHCDPPGEPAGFLRLQLVLE
jgi:hypothetical protein